MKNKTKKESDDELAAKKKKVPPPIVKKYFDVKGEVMLPATLTYRVLAEDAEQAVTLIKGKQPNSVNHKLIGRKELKIMVYDSGSTMIRLIKQLFGK